MGPAPNHAPKNLPITPHQAQLQRRHILIFVIACFFAYGLFESQADIYPKLAIAIDRAIVPLFIASSILWCAIEKRVKGETLGFWWVSGMFVAAPILLLIFFFRERGTKGGFVFTAKFVALNAALVMVAATGSMIGKYAIPT